jgi:2'-5' RNA ligase
MEGTKIGAQGNAPRKSEGYPRVFLALPLPEEVRLALTRLRRRLEKVGTRVSWVEAADYHLTLAFIGDLAVEQTEALGEALDVALHATRPFCFEVAGAGFFGPRCAPRVLWVGVPNPPPAMTALREKIMELLRQKNLPVEERPFHPHITLGRPRTRQGAVALTDGLAGFMNTSHGVVGADRVSLMAGGTSPRGTRYRRLHETILKG